MASGRIEIVDFFITEPPMIFTNKTVQALYQ
jgi:hypothetical protein